MVCLMVVVSNDLLRTGIEHCQPIRNSTAPYNRYIYIYTSAYYIAIMES